MPPTKEAIIKGVYSRFKGTLAQTYKRIKEDPKYSADDMPYITLKDVDYWFKHNHITLDSKYYYKREFNSFVAPRPKHTFQIDLFNFNYEQDQPEFEEDVPKSGLMCIDVFTKEVHVVPVPSKHAIEWEKAINECISKMGRPKIIMTDPDASMKGVVIDEWFKRNSDIKQVLTRHHASFAERALRMFKVEMYKLVKEDVKPWPEYLKQVLHRMNEGRQPIDYDNRVHGDDKVFPHKATGFTATEAAKPENWLEVHTNMEIQARHRRKYPEIQVGDEVKVYKQKSVHTKEVVSDYPNYPVKVKKITKSLGQTFYEVEGDTFPVLRADLILYKKGEGPVAEEPKEAVKPEFISKLRMRVRARAARLEAKPAKDKAKADAKAEAKAAKDMAKAEAKAAKDAAKAEEKAKKQADKADLLATRKRIRERSKAT